MTLHRLEQMRAAGEKIAMLTCYDAAFAHLLDEAGVDVLLVGDSLGMVIQGHPSTLPVSMEQVIYHTECVARGNRTAWVIADLPFGSYQESTGQAIENAVRLMRAGAHMIKLEGGGWTVPAVQSLVQRGIPVCAHLGFTPQSVHALGGYRVQGREQSAAEVLRQDAEDLAAAGARMLIIELVPSAVARELCAGLPISVVGIGAGPHCHGQVLVLHDMLGLTPGRAPRFVHNFMEGAPNIGEAVRRYVQDVKSGVFPDDAKHGY